MWTPVGLSLSSSIRLVEPFPIRLDLTALFAPVWSEATSFRGLTSILVLSLTNSGPNHQGFSKDRSLKAEWNRAAIAAIANNASVGIHSSRRTHSRSAWNSSISNVR